ncbi:MAG: TetR family transcriptional regulator [Actinobacteria bacterium]|nr:MAG: TetR family transcriptional regulator [Actinomycetota bacterium]
MCKHWRVSPRPSLTEQRKREILEAAGTVIASRGLGDTRIADLAQHLGTSPALILYYFESKERLLLEALIARDRQFFRALSEQLASCASAAESMRCLIEASSPRDGGDDRSQDEWMLWPAMWERARHDPELGAERARLDASWRRTIVDIVHRGIAAGEFREIDAEAFAIQLSAMLDGLALQVILDDPKVDAKTMRHLALQFASQALGTDL